MPATNRTQRSARMVRVAALAGVVLILGAFALAARSREQTKLTPAKSTITAPPLCVVGTPGCGPLPKLTTHHTAISQEAPRGPLRPGLLRPGTYNTPGWNTVGFHLVFTVPNGWNWNGQSLTKGNAAVYFSTGRVRVYADPCHWARPQPKHAPWNHVLVEDALAAQPMRHATRPKVIWSSSAGTGGFSGWSPVEVRLTVPSNIDFAGCDHRQYRTWRTARTIRSQQGPGQRDLIAIVYPEDHQLLIDAATFPDTPTRLVHQVDAILASVRAGDWG